MTGLPWFSSLWVVQEVMFNLNVILIYGSSESSWARFIAALPTFNKLSDAFVRATAALLHSYTIRYSARQFSLPQEEWPTWFPAWRKRLELYQDLHISSNKRWPMDVCSSQERTVSPWWDLEMPPWNLDGLVIQNDSTHRIDVYPALLIRRVARNLGGYMVSFGSCRLIGSAGIAGPALADLHTDPEAVDFIERQVAIHLI